MLERSVSRSTACGALLLCALHLAAPAHAQPGTGDKALSAELTRIAEINQRRRALSQNLGRQRVELTRSTQRADALQKQLDATTDAVARAKLLDQAADALSGVAYLTGQLQAGYAELHELESELTDMLASADADVARMTAESAARAAQLKAKQRALSLRSRAQLGPAKSSADKQAKLADELTTWKAMQDDAEARIEKANAEPRFASLTATPPRSMRALPRTTPGKVETLRACSVREVDWPNITFDVAGRSVQLIDGQGPIEPATGAESVSVRIKETHFGDTNRNGREEVFLLVEREEVTSSFRGESARETDGLYVLESAPDCSMRQLADIVLPTRGIQGKPVPGGYDYEAHDAFREFRWIDGILRETTVRSRLARMIR